MPWLGRWMEPRSSGEAQDEALGTPVLRSSALRPPVTGRTFPSRTFNSQPSVHHCVKNCTWGQLEIAKKGESDKFHFKEQKCYPFWHRIIDCEKVWFLNMKRSIIEKSWPNDGSLLRKHFFQLSVVRNDGRVQFLAPKREFLGKENLG